jgi:protein arginine N-methyltransferase 5
MDDLGSATYDIFERDPVKYQQYEEVSDISQAVLERVES